MQDAKKRAMLFGLLSLILASISGVLFINKSEEVDKKLGKKTTIYVASKNISPREKLTPNSFTAKELPTQYVPSTALRNLSGISQYVTVVPIVKGDFLTTHFLRKETELTSANNRLVFLARSDSVMYDQEVDRFDHVDIIVSKKTKSGKSETFLFLQNVPVIVTARDRQKVFQGAGLELSLEAAIKLIHEQIVADSIRILKAPQRADKETSSESADNNP
jgi:hypothetical protein